MINKTNQSIFEIFPDHCSTGVWMTAPGDDCHCSCNLTEIPFALHRRIVKKIEVMNQAYELFSDCGFPHPSISEEESFNFMVFDIYQDIRVTHPDQAHLFVVHPMYEQLFAQYDKQMLQSHLPTPSSVERKKAI